MSLLGILALALIAVIAGLIVLRIVASLALALFWPLLLITVGVAIGIWLMSRRSAA